MNLLRLAVVGLWTLLVGMPAADDGQEADWLQEPAQLESPSQVEQSPALEQSPAIKQPAQTEDPQQQLQDGEPPAPSRPLEELATPSQPAQTSPLPLIRPEYPSYAVGLHVDGNLVGRIRLAEPQREPVPLLAQVSFFRDDKLVDTGSTEPSGYFQLTRLVPGKYVVAVVCQYGQVNFEVEVRAFDKGATPEDMLLDVILLPNVDLSLLQDEVIPEPCSQCGAAAGGCCCQQQHHPWGLLGLAGLAGLAGLCDEDKPVSPFKPGFHN